MLKRLAFIFVNFFLFHPLFSAEAPVIDRFQYADEAALQKVWKPMGAESPMPAVVAGPEGRAMARFDCPFSTLKDWRVYWDRDLKLDLSHADRIRIKMTATGGGIAPGCTIYFRSGKGWYNFHHVGVPGNWGIATFFLKDAGKEDNPSGWDKIDGIRLCFLPTAQKDTAVNVSLIEAGMGWEPKDIGRLGPYANFKAASKALKGERMKKAAQLYHEVLKAKDSSTPEIQAKIVEGRRLVAESYALDQQPKPGEFHGFWCHNGDGPRGPNGERAKTWDEAIPLIAKAGFNAIFPNMLWSGV